LEDIPIGTVALAYTLPASGETIILIVHQALYFGSWMKHSLLNPNQLRDFGLEVDEVPRQFDTNSTHSIYHPQGKLRIPLKLNGIISYFNARMPTETELNECRQFDLTLDVPWSPYSNNYAKREDEVIARDVSTAMTLMTTPVNTQCRVVAIASQMTQSRQVLELEDTDLGERLVSLVNVPSGDFDGTGWEGRTDKDWYPDLENKCTVISSLASGDRESVLTKEVLARRWHIGLDTARRTLDATTQMGVRTFLHPLERRFRTRQSHMKFPTINLKVYTNTMFASSKLI